MREPKLDSRDDFLLLFEGERGQAVLSQLQTHVPGHDQSGPDVARRGLGIDPLFGKNRNSTLCRILQQIADLLRLQIVQQPWQFVLAHGVRAFAAQSDLRESEAAREIDRSLGLGQSGALAQALPVFPSPMFLPPSQNVLPAIAFRIP